MAVSVPDANWGQVNYSTSETRIGTWIDGKPLYQKTVNFGALPNNMTKYVNHGASNIKRVVTVFGYSTMAAAEYFLPIPFINSKYPERSVAMDATKTQVVIETTIDLSGYTETYITIQYTKTTD